MSVYCVGKYKIPALCFHHQIELATVSKTGWQYSSSVYVTVGEIKGATLSNYPSLQHNIERIVQSRTILQVSQSSDGETFPRVTHIILTRISIRSSRYVRQRRVPYNASWKAVFFLQITWEHPDICQVAYIVHWAINRARSHFVLASQSAINDPGLRSHRVACPLPCTYVQRMFFLLASAKRFSRYFTRKAISSWRAMRKYHA